MGKAGQGQRAKMVNQICIAGVLNGLSEGLVLAEKSGLISQLWLIALKPALLVFVADGNRATTMAQDKFDSASPLTG
ncbi:NAD-binding protein [Vibrio chagasii]|nr:NAD-binding protein [Vibrio chagasii]